MMAFSSLPFYGILIVFGVLVFAQGMFAFKAAHIKDICGRRSGRISSRIAGGKDTSGLWPWQVELLMVNKDATAYEHKCSGTLIDDQWVATAASCVFKNPYPTFYKVKIGKRDRSKKEPGEQEVYVDSLRINRDFLAGDDKTNDIALLKLANKVTFGRRVRPICLPQPMSRVKPKKMCIMTGWGRPAPGEEKAKVLQQARMPIVGYKECKAKNDKMSPIDDWTMLCAGSAKKKTSGCQGKQCGVFGEMCDAGRQISDSGGPLMCKEGSRWVFRGIASWGSMNCDGREAYSVFTRVSHFMHWIYFTKLIPPRQYPRCKDNHWHCGDWHEKGLCDNSFYRNALRMYCPETCGHCKE